MQRHDPNRSRWIPWAFAGGLLLVVVVNGVLIYAALNSFTGVTTGHAYDRGRGYNRVIEEARRQDALGWTARVAREGAMLRVAVQDREGLPVSGRLEGVMLRPLEGTEVALDFASVGPGQFLAHLALPAGGQWEARLALHGAAGDRLDIRQRVILP